MAEIVRQSPLRRRVLVLVLPDVHLLDLAGPVQAFYEADALGASYELVFCAARPTQLSAQGLAFGSLVPPPEPRPTDTVVVPGIDSSTLHRLDHVPVSWLRAAAAAGARVTSVCSAAFVLARAGLLDGRACTTHWKVADRLQAEYPRARVVRDRLYVLDGNIVTSAGVASGIDMALALVEADAGASVAARVAREMVVYVRRSGSTGQLSVFLLHRDHLHPGVHRVQDWLAAHPERRATLDDLARVAAMSARNLTRVFRRETGVSLKEYATSVKLEVAREMLQKTDVPLEDVADRCGLGDARTLRRLFRERAGEAPSELRRRARA